MTPTWQDEAACIGTDPDAFFPAEKGAERAARIIAAKKLCAGCPVQVECLTYATQNEEDYGVWGGLDAWERRKLRRAVA